MLIFLLFTAYYLQFIQILHKNDFSKIKCRLTAAKTSPESFLATHFKLIKSQI